MSAYPHVRPMRALVILIAIAFFSASSRGSDGYDAKWAADNVRRALQQREPIPWTKSKLVVPTEAVAVGIHIAIVRAAYGETALRDAPFHAIRSGDYWVAHGTLPKGIAGGTPLTVIRAKDGKVLYVIAEG